MPDVTANATVVYEEGLGPRIVLYRIRNVSTADTISVTGKFILAEIATAISASDTALLTVTGTPGTTLTLTLAGVTNDTVYLLVYGQSSV